MDGETKFKWAAGIFIGVGCILLVVAMFVNNAITYVDTTARVTSIVAGNCRLYGSAGKSDWHSKSMSCDQAQARLKTDWRSPNGIERYVEIGYVFTSPIDGKSYEAVDKEWYGELAWPNFPKPGDIAALEFDKFAPARSIVLVKPCQFWFRRCR